MLSGGFTAKIRSKTRVVCDARPIMHLDELRCLHLLNDFDKVLVPDGVRREVQRHRAITFENGEVKWVGISHEPAARMVGTRLSFRVHGTIGVLIRAIRRDLMNPNEVLDALNRISSESSLHVKPSLLRKVISRIRQEFDQ